MMIGEQNKDEKRRIKDEKRRIEDEKRKIEERRIKDEKRRIEDEKRRIEDEKRRIEDEKRRIEDEKRRIKEKSRIEDEKRSIKDEKRRIEDEKCKIKEIKRRIEDEIKRRIKDEKRRAVMEELIKTAKIYYRSCSPDVKDAFEKFFKDIDHDNDRRVSLPEFLEFMRQEGHVKMSSHDFFKTLNRKGRETLGFEEVLALFYIIQSGRPFCHRCDVFIAGMYFTCSKCYQSDNNNNVIFLCPKCFESFDKKLYNHPHESNQFLDNYALLRLKRKREKDSAGTQSIPQHQVQRTPSKVAASTSNATNAIVPHQPPHVGGGHKWKFAFQAMQLAVSAANLAGCVASSCTIM